MAWCTCSAGVWSRGHGVEAVDEAAEGGEHEVQAAAEPV